MTAGNTPPVALTTGESDSAGCAGIQADLKTFAAHGVYGTSAITALYAQNTVRVAGVHALAPDFVTRQIDAVAEDIRIDAAKTGMLGTAETILAVVRKLEEHGIEKLVVDPVLAAGNGQRVLDDAALDALRRELVPCAYVVTPNLSEASDLVGFAVFDESSVRGAARQIVEMGAKAVVIKGGRASGEECIDWLYDGRRFSRFTARRIESANKTGAGCVFSAAIAAQLARGAQLEPAVRAAKRYTTAALERGISIGSGRGPADPLVGEAVWPKRG